jgi:CubicO group peptidase (beta-lactamase class C family)
MRNLIYASTGLFAGGLMAALVLFSDTRTKQHIGLPMVTDGMFFAQNNEAKILGDSLDILLNQVAAQFGQKQINLTLGVVKNGKVFLKKHYGYSDPLTKTFFSDKTQIYIASTSKSFTGTLAAILHKKGMIRLDKTIADYLPGFSFDDKQLHPEKITMRSLLTHTHGISNGQVALWTAFTGHQGTAHILDLFKNYSTVLPDTLFSYSNVGPVLYSMIIEKQSGKPWQKVMEEELFRPLGMLSTTSYVSKVQQKLISHVIDEVEGKERSFFDKKDNSMSAAGGHLTTIDDMLKYLQFFISRGGSVPGILTSEQIAYAISPIVPQKNQYQSYARYGYGLGWEQSILNGEHLVSRFGGYSGIASHLSFLRNDNIGVVVLSNKSGLESLGHLVANYIYNALLGKKNKTEQVKENLVSLKRNADNEIAAKNVLVSAMNSQLKNDSVLPGTYYHRVKSGTMLIDRDFAVKWGNLSGKIYTLTDTSGMMDFGTTTRSIVYERKNGKLTGLYSNGRYFKKQ